MKYFFRYSKGLPMPFWALALMILIGQMVFAQDVSEDRLQQVAQSEAWHRLLHYRPTWRGPRTELDDLGFFFAKDGDRNPLNELKASIKAFGEPGVYGTFKIPAQCAFPERFRFVRETLGLTYKLEACPKLDEFMEMFKGPQGVSIVFSSAFPNNPASMFGHSFIKIKNSRKNELLNMGINFAAYSDVGNMLVFIYRGVFGGYRGIWSADPYFKKVNEYINSESRDLFEFDLNLSQAETIRLLHHIWELEINSHFDYFFFDENCSYQILRAIEAIRLDWNLTDHRIYVIPGETIKNLMSVPGAVGAIHYRPSLFHQLSARFGLLSDAERKNFQRLMRGKSVEPAEATPNLMEAALVGHMYKRAEKKGKWSDADRDAEDKVIELRHLNAAPASEITPNQIHLRARPDYGHDPFTLFVKSGYQHDPEELSVTKIKLRSSYHDLLSRDDGYLPFSEIEFPAIEFQASKHGLRLEELRLLRINSLFPLTRFSQKMSWRVMATLHRDNEASCDECLLQTVEIGSGVTLGGDAYRLYIMGLATGDLNEDLARGYRLSGGGETGAVWAIGARYKAQLGVRWFDALTPEMARGYRINGFFNQAFSLARNQQLRLTGGQNWKQGATRAVWNEINLEWVLHFR